MRAPALVIASVIVCGLSAPAAFQLKGGEDETGPYEVVANWPQPWSKQGYIWGSQPGIFAESPNRVFILERGEIKLPETLGRGFNGVWGSTGERASVPKSEVRNCIVVVDGNGKMIESWTQWDHLFEGGSGPHKVKISPYDPERHVWVINDSVHQIYKFSNDGKQLVMTLGERGVAGDDEKHFGQPQDLAFLPDGSIVIADGLRNARVVKLDRNGTFIKAWGTKGSADGQFSGLHGIDADKSGRVYVADRGNHRIQIFDADGKHLDTWPNLPFPNSVVVTADQKQVWVVDGNTHRILQYDPNGTLLYHWGVYGSRPGEFWEMHQFSVDTEGNLYIADSFAGRSTKLKPRPGADKAKLVGQPLPLAKPTRSVDEKALREYAGVYRWDPNSFVYLQMWDEFSGFGKPTLVAFDESGEVRTLYPTDRDQFFAGPGAAVSASIESRIAFQRDGTGKITSLTWQREGAPSRVAARVEIEKHEDVRFSSKDVQLTGTLISPATGGKHPAIILVHGSGAENREYMLPWARFLIRRGIAVLGYDKRGVGGSSGNWNTASFDDLAGDVVAAFEYLKTRSDIDRGSIGLLGISQAGWIMPLAAVRAKDIAFLISVSGAGVPVAETTIDQTKNELSARGTPPQLVEEIVGLLTLQYQYARTGQGWDEYATARAKVSAKMGGAAPPTIPGTQDDPYWQFIRLIYFYDPGPTLRQLKVPVLAIFGELDNNIVAEKNKAAWEAALKIAGNEDYTLSILPKANHGQFEAKVGSNAEGPSLQRFVPAYFTTIQDWLAKRIRGLGVSR